LSSSGQDLQDVTGDRRYEETLVSLHNFAKILSECRSLEEVYATTIDAMEKTLNFERVDILMIEGETLKQVAAHETLPKGIELPLEGPGVTVKAVHEKRSILVNDVNQNDDYLFVLDPATGEPDRRYALSCSELVSPILIDGRAVGVLNVESLHLDAFTEQDRMLLEMLAIHVANAISRIERVNELEGTIAKRTRELVSAERMVAAGRIASMVGHDLRGPLQAIKNAVYMLKNSPERSDEMIALIDRVVEQANAMIEELRNQIRDEPLQLGATDLASLMREAIGQAFNIGSPVETTVLDLAGLIKRLVGSDSPIIHVPYEDYFGQRHEDTLRRCPDITRASHLLGFTPQVSLESGLQDTIEWCRAHYQLRGCGTAERAAPGVRGRVQSPALVSAGGTDDD